MEFLENKINEEVENKVIPGISYAVINNGEVSVGSRGYKSLVPNIEKITNDTIYDVASLTKVIVTVPLILQLVDNKIINFDDKVNKYLPLFKYDDVTIYHLLTHTSGLPADLDSKEIVSKEKIMYEIYSKDKEFETGTKVSYSDLGYILLGKIIEKVYNKPLDIVAKEELFLPLEMYSTSYNPINKERCAPTEVTTDRGIVKGFVHDEKAYSLNGVAGHAGVFSTAKDLSHFAVMILNDGIYNDKRILSKEMIDILFKPLVYDERCQWHRSFCFIVGNNDIVIEQGDNIISFNGFTGPSISIDRDKNIGVVLMTNRIHPSRDNKMISKERPKISEEIYKNLLKTKRM